MADPGWSDHTDERHAWMFERVAASLQLEPEAPARGIEHSHLAQISHFFRGDAPRKLLWYLQPIRTATMPASATLRGGEGTSAAGADASGAIDDHDTSRRGGLRGVGGARSRGRSNRNTERGTTAAKHAGVLKFVVTSGEDVPLHGKCVYFLRTAPDGTDVTVDNINTSIVTGVVDGSDLLRSLQETLKFVMLPALKASPRWGDLERTDEDVEAFLEDVDRFVVMLEEVMGSLRSAVTLRMPEGRLHVENKPAAIAQAATDPDLVATCEGYVEEWCKQIEAVLTESEVVRKENDDIGPNAELEHWKSRMAKFNSITDQLKTLNVKIVVGIVAAAKSKKMEIWRALDTRITDAANEAKDNVKYLYTLERFAEPLYKSDPVQMVDAIPGLINAIKMMHSIARYYNTSERMTALFVKITNQMITCCKNYINADGDIWEQNRLTLIEKFAACQRLNDAYQDTFHRTRARLKSTPKDKQFDFSEMYIFGKFEIFCKRIKKLKDMFTIIEQFSSLRQSSIEDMDAIVDRFSGILAEMRNKHYDLLDLDTDAFEDDYVLFYENIINLERLLLVFINTSFEPVTSTARALQLLRQFKSVLLRKNLRKELENKYLLIFANYQRELDVIEKKFAVFEKRAQREIPPPLPRDTPLYAGAIAWARQLFRRIEEPMNLFSEHGDILETEESAKVVNVYNRLTIQIHRLQRWYHKQWCESTELIQDSVHATLLVRHPTKLNRLFVNFDKEIVEIIREAKSMQRMGLAIPPIATSLCVQEERYKNNYNALTFMLAEYERVTEKITRNLARKSSSNNLKLLFTPHVDAIKARLEPGLVTLKWTSLNIEPYVEGVHEALAELEELVDKANDIIECRVLKAVGHIETTLMVDLPRDETWTIASFAARTEEQCLEAAAFIDSKSVMAETAVNDLIGLITASYSPAEMGKLTDPIDRVTAEFKNITFNAIVAACRHSMEAVRSRVGVSLEAGGSVLAGVTFAGDTVGGGGGSGGPSGAGGGSSGNLLRGVGGGRSSAALGPDGDEIALGGMASEDYSLELHSRDGEGYFDVIRKKKDPLPTIYANDPPGASSGPPPLPLFRVELELQIPHVVMEPRMEDIQACLNHVGDAIENATKHIYGWDQDRTSGNTANLKNYFLEVSTKPEIAKLHRDLSTGINQLKGFVDTYLATFTMFDGLWRLSKQEAFEVFLQTEPTLHDYEGELRRYHKLEQDIASIPDIYSIGALAFDARPLKEALLIETGQWKQFYGVNLKSKSQKEMRFVLEFVDETVQRLGREVKDLDDIKAVMDVLALVREEEATIEMKIVPIENTYNTLNKYQIRYSKEEADGADRLTYSWESLKKEAAAKQDQLIALQPAFRRELLEHLAEFESDLHDFKRLYDAEGPRVEGISPRTALERLTAFTAMCAERQRKAETYNGGEVLFGLPKTNYDDLNSITEDLRKLDKLYGLYSEVIVVVGGYKELLWSDLNLDEIKAQVKTFQDRMRRLKKMKTWDAYIELKKTIDDIDRKIPLLEQLSSRAVQDRHWDSITEVTGHTFNRDPDAFKLRHILEAPLLQFEDQVYDICLSATNEAGIEQGLRAIQMDWNDANFEFKDFHGRGELVLDFDRTQEIMVMIEEALMKLHSLANSRYNKYFEAEIMLWTQKLLTCNREIEAWVSVQNLWIYLEAVFIGGDISRAMPVQAKEFQIIDKSWQKIMAAVHDNPNVVAFAYSDETLHNMLPHLQAKLEDCRSALGSYLEQKQRAFPRFYFLSPGSLLEVLGQCNSNTHSIKDHLHTVFANVKDVRFSQTDYDTIVGLISNEDEYVPLVRPMECEGNVEVWLAKLTEAMRQTMRRILHRGYGMFPQPEVKDALEGFIHEQQAQVSLVALQLWWTRECESALMNAQTNPQAIKEADTKSKKIFRRLLKLTRSFLDDVERVNVETLVTVHLHQFLVFRRLQSQGVSRPDHSEWLKQARFYLKTGDDIQIHITDVEFRYSYEYLGVSDRLVITPLTDQCYITLAQALGMSLGGAPAGPAGTGKTETVKDMGKALGKYVIIQNCAPEMRYYQLEKIFKGLAMSGCWGDFDEFNRITLPVLSVAAQQISRIFQAKKDRKKKFLYTDGTLVSIDWSCGIFITMNPTYTGRQELPENLKLQFRTVAMMIPDREKIMQVKLAAAGFDEFMTLAEKFRWLYQMCEEQLSKQHHYDFGLRNILSVLRTCGAVKRTNTGEDEAQLLQRVARDMNLSKLVNDDYRLFLELLDDLFPNAEQDRKSAVEQALAANIGRVCAQRGLVDHPAWHRKVVQLYETSLVRHGIIILGPSGAGKTECIRTLVAALNLEAQDAKDNPPAPDPNNPNAGPPAVPPTYREFRMNPKAMHPDKFLGTADKNTGEWDDGVFSALWKKFYKVLSKKKHDRIWLTMDGPIDSLWIESLNTVLDDTKKLTLPNNDRLDMHKNFKLLFEVDSVLKASPATVSRNGMIYMSDEALGWKPVLLAWIGGRSESERNVLLPLFEAVWDRLTAQVKEHLVERMEVPMINYIQTCVDLLEALLPPRPAAPSPQAGGHGSSKRSRRSANASASAGFGGGVSSHGARPGVEASEFFLNHCFIFAVTWSLGGLLDAQTRRLFHNLLEDIEFLDLPHAREDETVFDFLVDTRGELTQSADLGEWVSWRAMVPSYTFQPEGKVESFYNVIIPTVSMVRTKYLVSSVAEQTKNVLLTGESGTAKTVTLLSYLDDLPREDFVYTRFNFSSATTPGLFQETIEGSVDRRHNFYIPPDGKKMNVFIDDISMPQNNEHGDQPTNEIVRQLIEEHGFYNLEKTGEFKQVLDLQFLAAMFQPGGGRNDIPDRLKRHFSVFNVSLPPPAEINYIYSTMITGFFNEARGFARDVVARAAEIAPLMQRIWEWTKENMLPTPENFHYMYNLRDLSRITEGLLLAEADVVTNAKLLFQLFKHEADRVLCDKLSLKRHKNDYSVALENILTEALGAPVAAELMEPVYFVDFLRDEPDDEDIDDDAPDDIFEKPKIYEPIKSIKGLRSRIQMFLNEYNAERGQYLDLVLFGDCIAHVVRVSRLIARPRGNALLVGVGGSGKKSVARLASHIAGYPFVKLSMSRSYNTASFLEDLQRIYKDAGSKDGGPLTFCFADGDIKEEGFLEYINSFLTSGAVTAIMPKEDMETIVMDLRPLLREEQPNTDGKSENVTKFFVDRVRRNVHLVLSFSAVGEKFRNRALKFPGLISGCGIDWFEQWPKDALTAVAERFVGDPEVDIVSTPKVRISLIQYMSNAHYAVERKAKTYYETLRRRAFVTPKSYITFIQSYIGLYAAKKAEVDAEADRMRMGLQKLEDAGRDVSNMSKLLAAQNRQLKASQDVMDEMMVRIVKSSEEAARETERVEKIKDEVEAQAEIARGAADQARLELEKAMPALLEAQEALDVIEPRHINELKQGNNPVHFTQRVLECVRIMRYLPLVKVAIDEGAGKIKTSWSMSVVMMKKGDFLSSLGDGFPLESLNGEMIDLLEPFYGDEEFTADRAESINFALLGLFKWVNAMMKYYREATNVEPMKRNEKKAMYRLELAEAKLREAEAVLEEKDAVRRTIQAEHDGAARKKEALEAEAAETEGKINTARELITELAGEKERWTEKSLGFQDDIRRLIGDAAVATAFVSYAGPFSQEYRADLVETWLEDLTRLDIPSTTNLDVVSLLADDNRVSRWHLESLPTDEQSVQNGVIVHNSASLWARFPLLIDPQGQGNAWIREHEESRKSLMEFATLTQADITEVVKNCVSSGRPLLIEDVQEELIPSLDNVLEKGVKAGSRIICKVGDETVDFHPDFRLYLTTKLANPRFTPEILAKVAVVDFTVTRRGLEDQLLGRVIGEEKAQLEVTRMELLKAVSDCKRKIRQMEERLLDKLSSVGGSLVDDPTVMEVLTTTKMTALDARQKLKASEDTEAKIADAREKYRGVATRGSILYFLVMEMAEVNPMYQTSLQQFTGVFYEAIRDADQHTVPDERRKNIINKLTDYIFAYVTQGLLEDHKFLFVLQMGLKIDLAAGRISPEAYNVLIKGRKAVLEDDETVMSGRGAALSGLAGRGQRGAAQQVKEMLTADALAHLKALSHVEGFYDILNQIEANFGAWQAWYNLPEPEEGAIPNDYEKRLSDNLFERMLLIRCIAPDRFYFAAQDYIEQHPALGVAYTKPPVGDFLASYEQSKPSTPIICLLSLGADPSENIKAAAKSLRMPPPRDWSMGEGQKEGAQQILAECMESGEWMLLQNCHLGLDFMEELSTLMPAAAEAGEIHPEFRLWLTTAPVDDFPISLLHISLKLTNDPPQGLQAGLIKTFNNVWKDKIDAVEERDEWRPLMFSICFMHSVVQERRKFKALGWNTQYEFNQSDLVASLAFLQKHLDELDTGEEPDWEMIRYMICAVHYGGRVTDKVDELLMKALGEHFLKPEVVDLNNPYQLAPGYLMPDATNEDGYKQYIAALEPVDLPDVFHLHRNADITYRSRQAEETLQTILLSLPAEELAGDGESPEIRAKKIALKKLPQIPPPFPMSEVRETLQEMDPLSIFLLQEIQRIQVVSELVLEMLQTLIDAVNGIKAMSDEISHVIRALNLGIVPAKWTAVSWEAASLEEWITSFRARHTQYQNWLNHRPTHFDIGLMFNAQGFLTAVLQEYGRNQTPRLSLNRVSADTKVCKTAQDENKKLGRGEGVFVTGLILEGASWRNSKLNELQQKDREINFPTLWFGGIEKRSEDLSQYQCPIYKSRDRTEANKIIKIALPSGSRLPDHWVKRGVALLALGRLDDFEDRDGDAGPSRNGGRGSS